MKSKGIVDLFRVPAGVQYFFDDEVALRRSIERDVMDVFAGWGYSEIVLPIFDAYDLFSLAMSDLAERAYRFTARDGSSVALRPDLTSLVARTVATRLSNRPRPLRLCYTGEVFRADEPRRGRQHEFHQLGIEHVGWASPESDIEVLLIAIEALRVLGLADACVTLGHVGFFNGVAARLDLAPERTRELQDLVDRRRTDALSRFLATHASHVPETDREDFCRLIGLGGGRDVLDLGRTLVGNKQSLDALDDLDRMFDTLDALGFSSVVRIDLGEIANLEYYTGMTFKIYAPGWGLPIGSGGRYDALLAQFGADEPAVGFSLSLDWLAGALAARKLDAPRRHMSPRHALIADKDLTALFGEAQDLRSRGESVEIVPARGDEGGERA